MEQVNLEDPVVDNISQINQKEAIPSQSDSQSSSKKLFVILGLVFGFILFEVGWYILGMQKSNEESSPNKTVSLSTQTSTTPVQASPVATSPTQEANQVRSTCTNETTNVIFDRGEDETDGNITVTKEDKSKGETTSFVITKAAEKHAHFIDIHKCHLYVKRLLNEGHAELWQYNFNGDGKVIYESRSGLDFNINDSEKFLAIDTDLEVVILEVKNERIIHQFPATKLKSFLGNTPSGVLEGLGIKLRGWNTESSELWGSLWAGPYVEAFWKLDINTGGIEVFSGFEAPTPNGVALNPDKEVYAYSDKPLFFDVEGFENWQSENPTYSIYIYSLRDKSSILVDTLPSNWSPGMLNPLRGWDSPTRFKYSTPSGDKIYTLRE